VVLVGYFALCDCETDWNLSGIANDYLHVRRTLQSAGLARLVATMLVWPDGVAYSDRD
jgi:hypothetical protein